MTSIEILAACDLDRDQAECGAVARGTMFARAETRLDDGQGAGGVRIHNISA
jgi:hypothetical protein